MNVENVAAGSPEADNRLNEGLNKAERPTGLNSASPIDGGPMATPLMTLKSIVLSMDWEISDAILTEFILELNRLKTVLKDDGVVVKCLQLLEAIGKYILQKKAQTHPDSIRLLQSIYRDLEILLLSKGVSENTRRSILADEIAQFKRLKEKLAEPPKPSSGVSYPESAEKTGGVSIPAAAEPPHGKSVQEQGPMPPHEAFLYAVEEMKKTIQAEFGAIRAELKLWRKER